MRKAWFGCGSTEHVIKNCPKNTNVQQVEEDVPEILFIGNVQNKEALEGWKQMPMKVTLGDLKDTPMGADPEDSYWSDGRGKEQVQGA